MTGDHPGLAPSFTTRLTALLKTSTPPAHTPATITTSRLTHRNQWCRNVSRAGRSRWIALAAAAVVLLTPTGCSASVAHASTPEHLKVGVILPDIETTAEWEQLDKPLLKQALNAQGLQPELANAQGDGQKFTAIADDMIKDGVKVLVIDPPTTDAGTAVASKAKAHHIPTIDYDRLDLGATWDADYAVSFDNIKAGDLQARGLIRGVRGKPGANIIELDDPLSDPNALLFEQGQRNILKPRYDTGKYQLVASQRLENYQQAGAVFEQLLNANAGQVDGVLTANDSVADAVITVLRKRGLTGKIPVTGQGATPEALKAILRGDQFMTVFNPNDQLATAAAKLANALATGQQAAADTMVSTMTTDPTNHLVRLILVPPQFITLDTIKQVTGSKVIDSRDICEGELELRCNQLSIS